MKSTQFLLLLWQKCRCLALFSILFHSSLLVSGQYRLRLRIAELPPNHGSDSLFVAGSFNGWHPARDGIKPASGDSATIDFELPGGEYQFKFTRGSWQSVEAAGNGANVENRHITLTQDTIVAVSVAAWKDDFKAISAPHTASRNVRIIDTAFAIPQLGRTRRIWLYLPPGYSKVKKRYPVIYLQDGQNLFDDQTASFGEWRVDECVDSMIRRGRPASIIVGIDNGPFRLTEYNPYDFEEFGKGEGKQYLDWLVNNLKPYIDKHYRTLPGPQQTSIAGSSMGGLISYYALLAYPEVFTKGGIFSPAFWTAESIKKLTDSSGQKLKGTLFFYMGGRESQRMIEDMKEVTDLLGKRCDALIYVVTDPYGEHNEAAWRKWFPEFYRWVLAKGFNSLVNPYD